MTCYRNIENIALILDKKIEKGKKIKNVCKDSEYLLPSNKSTKYSSQFINDEAEHKFRLQQSSNSNDFTEWTSYGH